MDTETWYLLTSADHNIVQINIINSDGTVGDLMSDLRKSPSLFSSKSLTI